MVHNLAIFFYPFDKNKYISNKKSWNEDKVAEILYSEINKEEN